MNALKKPDYSDSLEAQKARSIVEQYKNSPVVWVFYEKIEGEWKLLTAIDNKNKAQDARTTYEKQGKIIRIYGQHITRRICKVVYTTAKE